MTGAIAARTLDAWALCATVQLMLWLIAQRTKNAAIVDVGWAATFALVVGLYALRATARPGAWLSIAFPAISTGIFGYPFREAQLVAIETIRAHAIMPERVILCTFGEEATQITRELVDGDDAGAARRRARRPTDR